MSPADEPPAQFHFEPETYAEMIRADVPRYEELQERAIEAIPFAPARVLELGFGTAETTQRLLDRYPEPRITGLDSSPRWSSRRASSAGRRCASGAWRTRSPTARGTS